MSVTVTVGTGFSAGTGAAQSPVMPSGVQAGDLVILITASSTSAATAPSTPLDYSILGNLSGTDPHIVFGKIANSTEVAPALGAWGSGASCGVMLLLRSSTGWPAIGSILATGTNPTEHYPNAGTTTTYSSHTVIGNGNCILRTTEKNGTFSGTPTAVALTSGYTAAGFANGTNCMVAAEMLTALSTIGSNPAQVYATVTGESGSTNRSGLTFEFVPVAPSTTISISTATPTATQAVTITKAEGAFAGTVTVELTDNNGAYVDVSAAVTGSGSTRTLTLGAGAVTNYDDANATWERIRWGQVLTLRVEDADGPDTETLTIQPPVADHFDALGASGIYVPTGAIETDELYVHIVSGDGEGLPVIADLQGNTVPTVANFMAFDISADKWLTALSHTFDVASVTLDGQYADSFTDSNGTLITAHAPTTRITPSTVYTIEKDISTAAAVSNSVTIQDNKLRINDANEGAVINVGTVQPDYAFDWVIPAAASGLEFIAQVRRKDDTEHIHVYVKQDGTIRVNERVASANVGVSGTNEVTYSGGFLASTTYRFRIYVVGTDISVYVNDALQLQVSSNREPASTATYVGLFAAGAGTFPIEFDSANCYSDYVSAARTITASDTTPKPADVITLTVGNGVMANSTYSGTINGVTATLGSKTTSSCTMTIPALSEFDAAGSMVNALFNRNIAVRLDDGTNTPSTTIQIEPPVAANFGTVSNNALVYPPAGIKPLDDCYVNVISGTGTAQAADCNYIAATTAVVRFMGADVTNQVWLPYREETISVIAVAGMVLRGVVRSIARDILTPVVEDIN